ncbi:hypothetical protein AAEX28_11560 [Lentisphaerota bacterium WC36G]|nr:hypothetical protein LJT99_14395 [Lentisphaerae bacterium WC36]
MRIVGMLISVGIIMVLAMLMLRSPSSLETAASGEDDLTQVDSAAGSTPKEEGANKKQAKKTLAGRATLKQFKSVGKALDKTDEYNKKAEEALNDQ